MSLYAKEAEYGFEPAHLIVEIYLIPVHSSLLKLMIDRWLFTKLYWQRKFKGDNSFK